MKKKAESGLVLNGLTEKFRVFGSSIDKAAADLQLMTHSFMLSCLGLSLGFAFLQADAVPAQAEPDKPCRMDNDPVRIQQARQIIDDSRELINFSTLYIAQSEKNLDEAKKLRGEARKYQGGLQIKAPLLKGKALQDARRQFSLDLTQFQNHVKQYNLHTLEVRKSYGSCQASLAAYEKMKKELSLHCDQFHMKNIEPPHICVEMGTSVQEATSMQSKVLQQAKRVVEAERDLAKEEMRLQKAISSSNIIDSEVMKKSVLALKEQDLAAEFGRLKEEHSQLEVERRALSRSGVKVGTAIVKARKK